MGLHVRDEARTQGEGTAAAAAFPRSHYKCGAKRLYVMAITYNPAGILYARPISPFLEKQRRKACRPSAMAGSPIDSELAPILLEPYGSMSKSKHFA
jgi:hypothetical protein